MKTSTIRRACLALGALGIWFSIISIDKAAVAFPPKAPPVSAVEFQSFGSGIDGSSTTVDILGEAVAETGSLTAQYFGTADACKWLSGGVRLESGPASAIADHVAIAARFSAEGAAQNSAVFAGDVVATRNGGGQDGSLAADILAVSRSVWVSHGSPAAWSNGRGALSAASISSSGESIVAQGNAVATAGDCSLSGDSIVVSSSSWSATGAPAKAWCGDRTITAGRIWSVKEGNIAASDEVWATNGTSRAWADRFESVGESVALTNAELITKDATFHCESMLLRPGAGEIGAIECSGISELRSSDVTITGTHLRRRGQIMEVSGDPFIIRQKGGDEVTGQSAAYDMATGAFSVRSTEPIGTLPAVIGLSSAAAIEILP